MACASNSTPSDKGAGSMLPASDKGVTTRLMTGMASALATGD